MKAQQQFSVDPPFFWFFHGRNEEKAIALAIRRVLSLAAGLVEVAKTRHSEKIFCPPLFSLIDTSAHSTESHHTLDLCHQTSNISMCSLIKYRSCNIFVLLKKFSYYF